MTNAATKMINQAGNVVTRWVGGKPAQDPYMELHDARDIPGIPGEDDHLEDRSILDKIDDETPDYIGDPEGAGLRIIELKSRDFPSWVWGDYEMSSKNLWGKPYKDGVDHLTPKASVIEEILEIHNRGEKNYEAMVSLARRDDGQTLDNMILHFEGLMLTMPEAFRFSVMQNIQQNTSRYLAERAFQKYAYMAAGGRVDPTKPLPEFVENIQTKMMDAAIHAGMWYEIHRKCWTLIEWKDSPKYPMVKNDIMLRMQNQANWVERTQKEIVAKRATVVDHNKIVDKI